MGITCKATVEGAKQLVGAMASKKNKKKSSGVAAAATAVPIFAIDADDAARPQKKQKNLSVEVNDVDNDKSQINPPPLNKNKRKRGKSSVVRSTSAPKKHGLKIKSAKKTILSEDRVSWALMSNAPRMISPSSVSSRWLEEGCSGICHYLHH